MIITSSRAVPQHMAGAPGLGFWTIIAELGASLLGGNKPPPTVAPTPFSAPSSVGLWVGGAVGILALGGMIYYFTRDAK